MAVMAGEPGTAVHPVTRFRAGLTVSWPHGRRLANLERLPTGLPCPRRRVQTVPRLLGWSRLFEIYDLLCEAVCGSQRALLLNSRRNFATKSSPFRFVFSRLGMRARHRPRLVAGISGIAPHRGGACDVPDKGEFVPSSLLTFKSYFARRSKICRSALLNALL